MGGSILNAQSQWASSRSMRSRAAPSQHTQQPTARCWATVAEDERAAEGQLETAALPRHRQSPACARPQLTAPPDRLQASGRFGRDPSYDVPNNRTWRSLLRAHSWAWRSLRCYRSGVECESDPGAGSPGDSRTSSRAVISIAGVAAPALPIGARARWTCCPPGSCNERAPSPSVAARTRLRCRRCHR